MRFNPALPPGSTGGSPPGDAVAHRAAAAGPGPSGWSFCWGFWEILRDIGAGGDPAAIGPIGAQPARIAPADGEV